MSATGELDRVHDIVDPIASDLDLDVYDVERRGATIRVTLDTQPGSEDGITLDNLALATRLISREMDHADPIPGRYTLEVTSPGLERHLRTTAHFRREVGKDVTVRLRGVESGDRRIDGVLVAADDSTATVRLAGGGERVVDIGTIDRARTVFEWGSKPKPGGKGKQPAGGATTSNRDSTKESQTS
jgi:ribosome maturation factor RimP